MARATFILLALISILARASTEPLPQVQLPPSVPTDEFSQRLSGSFDVTPLAKQNEKARATASVPNEGDESVDEPSTDFVTGTTLATKKGSKIKGTGLKTPIVPEFERSTK